MTPEQIRALDAARPALSDLKALVAHLAPAPSGPGCGEAAREKLEEIVKISRQGRSGYRYYLLHSKLLEIASGLREAPGLAVAAGSLLERMKRAEGGISADRMVESFLHGTARREIDGSDLREALWLYDLNSLSDPDQEGTVLDLGSPARLKAEADLALLLSNPARVRNEDFFRLLEDLDRPVREKALHWLRKRRDMGLLTPAEKERLAALEPPEDAGRRAFEEWLDGRHILSCESEGLRLDISPREGSKPAYRIVGQGKNPVFIMAEDLVFALDDVIKEFGRIFLFPDPGETPEGSLRSRAEVSDPGEKPWPLSFAWDRERNGLAVRWKAAGHEWILRPSEDGSQIMIVEGSLKAVLDDYFGIPG